MTTDSEELFRVFRLFWADLTGSDRPVRVDDRIDEWLSAEDLSDDIDFADVLFRIGKDLDAPISIAEFNERFLSGHESKDDWECGAARNFTFGRLVELIASKSPDPCHLNREFIPVMFGPISVAGRTCASAGAFIGIRALASNIDPQVQRFGPSSRICDVLKGRFRNRFWRLLRIQVGDSVPPLTLCSQRLWVRLAFVLWYLGGGAMAGLICAHVEPLVEPPDPSTLLFILSVIHGVVIVVTAMLVDDLCGGFPPAGIDSFRDLAFRIATSTSPKKSSD